MIASIAIIVPVFNNATTIRESLESLWCQDYSGQFQVIVVDDGSTDETPAILSQYQSRSKILRQSNRGAAAARNLGVSACSSEWLAFLDADDIWVPHKLWIIAQYLHREPRPALIYSNAVEVDEESQPVSTLVPADKAHAPSLQELLTEWWPILPSTAIMRRDVFEKCGGFPEALRSYEDPYLFLRAREHGDFVYIAEPLVRYRRLAVGRRMEKYAPYQDLFIQMLHARYGRAARARIRNTRKAYSSALGHQGLIALRQGDRHFARQSFVKALQRDPLSARTALRLLRSFLPQSLARALSRQGGVHYDALEHKRQEL